MSSKKRPAIPAELRRKILVEAGHRCAISRCRSIVTVDAHHIIPWEKCKKHEYKNLIALCPNCHRMVKEGKIDRKSLRMHKSNLRFALEKYSQFETDILFELSKTKDNEFIPFPSYFSFLVNRILEANFVKIIRTDSDEFITQNGVTGGVKRGMYAGGIKIDPDCLVITDEGRDFIKSLGIKNIGY